MKTTSFTSAEVKPAGPESVKSAVTKNLKLLVHLFLLNKVGLIVGGGLGTSDMSTE